jgi:hypothetical protein
MTAFSEPESLRSVHRGWGQLDERLIGWLLDQGVSEQSMLSPWPIGGARVRFFDTGTFDAAADGIPAVTFRAGHLGAEPDDLIAWSPRSGKIGSWRGTAAFLGDPEQIDNPATYFAGGKLTIHTSPLQWLKANREGLVIVRPELAYVYLRNVPSVFIEDISLARNFKTWVQPPKPTVRIFTRNNFVKRQAA